MQQSQELTHHRADAMGMLLCQVFVDIESAVALVIVALNVFTRIWPSVTHKGSCTQMYSVLKLNIHVGNWMEKPGLNFQGLTLGPMFWYLYFENRRTHLGFTFLK